METYRAAGVDYDVLDEVKRMALVAASATTDLAQNRGCHPVAASRGESAFVAEMGGLHLGFVLECLGTKVMIAREFYEQSSIERFHAIGSDTVAAAVNDLAAVGVLPVMVNAYFAAGSVDWFRDLDRTRSLVEGFRSGCEQAGATWGGGETPVLVDLVGADEIDLAAAAVGATPSGHTPLLGDALSPGDEIVLVESSGLHTNGASLARAMAGRLESGWLTELPSGRPLGDALLDPSRIYVDLMADLLARSVPVTYAVHVTGHGLRKLMRSPADLTYRVSELPEVPEVLRYLAEATAMDDRSAYGTLNMGVGFAIFCEQGSGEQVVETAVKLGHRAAVSGLVEAGPRRVVLEPLGIEFSGDDLQIR